MTTTTTMATVTISVASLKLMQDRLDWLEALEWAGVDNWEGYSEAAEIYREDHPEDEDDL